MSKNYDNWERLVRVVLRREHDRQIAIEDSRDPSTISSSSSLSSRNNLSFSSSFGFDTDQSLVVQGETSKLPEDYSDLSMDHKDWKALLPENKQELLMKSASISFFLDQKTRKNCFLLGGAKLTLSSSRGEFEPHWEMKPHPKSRFSEVVELIESPKLDIRVQIKTQMLSPETLYAAYLVFGLSEGCGGDLIGVAYSTITCFYDPKPNIYPRREGRVLNFRGKSTRVDGWMEVEMGDFYVREGENRNVEARLMGFFRESRSSLIVEGVEFRPKEGKGFFSNFRISS